MVGESSIALAPATVVSSGDGTQRPRRVRTSKPKVKTGCNNCKQRRIKCDEQRPDCTQCVRSKKRCTGYPPPPRAKIFEEIRIAPKPGASIAPVPPRKTTVAPARPRVAPQIAAAKPSQKRLTPPQTPTECALTLHRPSTLPFDQQEAQYFQLFREHTASELSGFFDSSFWTRHVLQECHSEEAIRHSVVALGALYKTLEKMSESPPGSPSDMMDFSDHASRHWEFAFRHYSLAINAVVNSASQDQTNQRMSLMASVLLACFDSFIGHHKQAIVQIQSGLRLLETLRAERRRAFLPHPEEPVEQDLLQMFTRLAIQAKSYDMAFHFPQPYVIRLTPQGTENPTSPSTDGGSPVSTSHAQIPDAFSTLFDARLAWDNLVEQIMRFTETMFTHATMGPMGVLPVELKQYGMSFGEQIEAWSRAFDPILASRTAPAKSSQEKTAIAALKMSQIMSKILFFMTFSDSELAFDPFLPSFREIVSLAMEVIGDEERRAAAKRCPNPHFCQHHSAHPDIFGGQYTARHIKPSFSADLGIVPPLFVVATKCRDPLTRRQAIQLLRTSSRREGMWDSELTARIATWIANIEEEDDGSGDTGRPPSSSTEASRFSMGSPSARSTGSPVFGDDVPLGPGGNARWDSRNESMPVSPHGRAGTRGIPEEKRVMVRAVEFDLRQRWAILQCGTRGLIPGTPDLRTRVTRITW
ncbi:Uu.00g093690.m01.CDS01 [Anthostomella pinea]|uniref:Uu.00g093690.m01.CDS01 n=1 Tax=Anthostomella pinea TaxID=933095 RepID=A0AAI8VI19_9PEZI|nr:Uu.00g093690.m01.CDS01 [Anthostomella pinea]